MKNIVIDTTKTLFWVYGTVGKMQSLNCWIKSISWMRIIDWEKGDQKEGKKETKEDCEKREETLSAEERLKRKSWRRGNGTEKRGWKIKEKLINVISSRMEKKNLMKSRII